MLKALQTLLKDDIMQFVQMKEYKDYYRKEEHRQLEESLRRAAAACEEEQCREKLKN